MRLIDADELLKKGINLSWSVQKWVSEVDIGLMPTVDAEPVKHGKWKDDGCCSFCDNPDPYYHFITEYKSYYCPHCGARMEVE